jgi:hypothetical protein
MSKRVWLVCLFLLCLVPTQLVAAASSFADPQFQTEWQQGEAGTPNFWGPLSTAHDGQQEPYKEGTGGQRLVQYFDKARMELRRPPFTGVSTGLLTVELKTGAAQIGDATFDQRVPAKIGLVGDPGSPGPTYADLALIPEKDSRPILGGEPPAPYFYQGGAFTQAQNLPSRASTIPQSRFAYKLDDPSGRYSQYVFYPFWDFIQSLPLPLSQTTGYAISPIIWVHATVGGKPTEVLVQAFERRVLTWNDSATPGKEVEFGNIGQHYYQWRYGNAPPPAAPIVTAAPAPAPTAAPSPTTSSIPMTGESTTISRLGVQIMLPRHFLAVEDASLAKDNAAGFDRDDHLATLTVGRFSTTASPSDFITSFIAERRSTHPDLLGGNMIVGVTTQNRPVTGAVYTYRSGSTTLLEAPEAVQTRDGLIVVIYIGLPNDTVTSSNEIAAALATVVDLRPL